MAKLQPVLGHREAQPERGSCGIRRRLLEGGAQRQFAVSRVEIHDARPHVHRHTWELYVVQEGRGVIELDGIPVEIMEGDVIEIPPNVVHRAIPSPTLTVLVVMSPHNAESNDLEYVES